MRHILITLEFPDLPMQAFQKALGKNRPVTLEGKGGGGGGQAPQAPDPWVTAAATTQANKDTGAYNKALNLNNYTNPFGSQTSYVSGYDPQTGAPIYQTNIAASSQLQNALNNSLAGLGQADAYRNSALGGIQSLYGQLGGLNSDAARKQGQDAYYKSATAYLDPQYAQQQESLDAKLAAQGLAPGSQAYNNAMGSFQRDKDFAYNQAANSAITQGQQLGLQNLSAQQGIIGQQAGLLGQGVGIGQTNYSNLGQIAGLIPGYSGPATSSVNPADIGGYMNNAYQGQLGAYNAGQQGRNQFTSGLLGLAGTLGAGYLMSDARVKRDIRRIGEWNGTPVYSYRYLFESKKRIGVLAQEAPKHAVSDFCGLMMVDYGSL